MNGYRLGFAIGRYFEFGGLQRDLCRIACACVERGHEVHVLTGDWQGSRPEGINVHLLELGALTNHGRNEKLGRAVADWRRRENFDCVVGFKKMAGLDVYFVGDVCLAAKLAEEKPVCLRWLPRYRAYLRQEAVVYGRESDSEILVLTADEQATIMRYYGVAARRFHLLGPGIDRDRLCAKVLSDEERAALRRALGVGEDDVMILTVGSSFRTKGVDRAIIALSSLAEPVRRRCKFVVVGKGKAKAFMRLARRLGVGNQVIFTGGRDDVADLYRCADLLVHAARSENTGLTLLEAMVCGLPVLVTANCGYAFHVGKAEAGMVCPEPFVQANLNARLSEMIGSGARAEWRKNARAYSESADLYSMVDQAVEVIVERARRNRQTR